MEPGSWETRQALKAWRQRNSDGRNTFEGEKTQSPPTWDYEEGTLPPTATIDAPETTSGYDRRAIRAEHIFDPALAAPTVLWRPNNLPTGALLAWYDARDLVPTYADNDKVLRWPDRSGNDNHATQSNPANAPALDDDEFASFTSDLLVMFWHDTTEGLAIDQEWPDSTRATVAYYTLSDGEGAIFQYGSKESALEAMSGDPTASSGTYWRFILVYWDSALASDDDADRIRGYLAWEMPSASRDNVMNPDHPYYNGPPTIELA